MPIDTSIDFWFSIGSTYTYLTVMRLPEIEERTGIQFNWRPFSVRKIMVEMNNIPFTEKPTKAAYMWRDIERRAQRYGIKAVVPAPYPIEEFDPANKVAVLGSQEGWCKDYTRATYRRWFQEGSEPGSEPNLSSSLEEIGQDPKRVLSDAMGDRVRASYFAATDEARETGIFGAPTFVVDGEIFWGDDRLEDAIDWCQNSRR